MKKKTAILILCMIIIFMLAVAVLRFVAGGPEDDWICVNGGWVQHGVPSAPMPTGECNK